MIEINDVFCWKNSCRTYIDLSLSILKQQTKSLSNLRNRKLQLCLQFLGSQFRLQFGDLHFGCPTTSPKCWQPGYIASDKKKISNQMNRQTNSSIPRQLTPHCRSLQVGEMPGFKSINCYDEWCSRPLVFKRTHCFKQRERELIEQLILQSLTSSGSCATWQTWGEFMAISVVSID